MSEPPRDNIDAEVLCTGMCLPLRSGDQNGNAFPCRSSLDSTRSISSLSDSCSPSPQDVEMLEYRLGQGDPFSKQCSSAPLPQKPGGCHSVGTGTAALDPGDKLAGLSRSAETSWNKNMTFVVIDSQAYRSDGCSEDSSDLSPDLALNEEARQWASQDDRSISDSRGDSAASVSSSSMVMRSSLGQSDSDKPLSASVLGQSSDSSSDLPEAVMVSGALPDVCEGLMDKTQTFPPQKDLASQNLEEKLDSLRDGDAVFPAEDRSMELPCEREEHRDSADGVNEGQRSPADERGTLSEKTFVVIGSEDSDAGCNAQTSTPVQGSENQTFILTSFSESPFQMRRANVESPAVGGRGWQRGTTPAKPTVGSKAPVPMPRKATKAEVKCFPKQPDLKIMKPRAVQRPPPPLKLATPTTSSSRRTSSPAGSLGSHEKTPVAQKAGQKRPAGPDDGNRRRSSSSVSKVFSGKLGGMADGAPALKTKREAAATETYPNPCGSVASDMMVSSRQLLTKANSESRRNGDEGDGLGAKGCSAGKVSETPRVVSSSTLATPSKQPVSSEGGGSRFGVRPSPGKVKSPSPALARGAASASGGKMVPGTSKTRLTERPNVAMVPKLPLNPSLRPPRPLSKLPVKGPPKSPSSSSLASSHSAQQSGALPPSPASGVAVGQSEDKPPRPGAAGGAPPCKAVVKRNRTSSLPGRSAANGSLSRSTVPSPTPPRPSVRPAQRPCSVRPQRPAGPPMVDKTRPRPMTRSQQAQGPPDLLLPDPKASRSGRSQAQCDRQNLQLQQLHQIVASRTQGLEALAVVVQHISTQREEALKRKKELMLELVNLQEELVNSTSSCELLQQEKEELRVTLEGVLQKVQEQHQQDLADLEDRLKAFYSDQWEELHQAYQKEADRCRNLMQQQVDELRSRHEAQRSTVEASHAEAIEKLKEQYEASFEELRKAHEQEVQALNQTMKQAEITLTGQVEELMAENNTLYEKLKAEEERRRVLAEKNQKDSHTLYLEQELESLKVVLDIKNKQLHQQDQKLMQMDKLVETNVKLEESLKKVQQENEDYRVRMDKHAALSRQLSSEQAVLQQCLQKETKVNKRLSMENEELLWKLHNGDLSSPRKLSPTSPFQSPRNSAAFSSHPLPPR
uniref:Microtubule-associated tumor suppressor 1 n=2 Tax=Scleropages formosus TaxID=113540 RepID=A0A8C9UXA7_SCLFO